MLKPSYILSFLLRQVNVGEGFPFASHFSVIKLPFSRLLEWTILGASKKDTSHLTKKNDNYTNLITEKKWEPKFNTWRDNYSSRYKYTRGGGVLPAILGGVCPPFLQILTLFQSKNVIFHLRFQTWPLKSRPTSAETVCQHYLDWNSNILKFIFEFANYSFCLIHLEWKRQIHYTRSRSSLEPYPIADQNGQNL